MSWSMKLILFSWEINNNAREEIFIPFVQKSFESFEIQIDYSGNSISMSLRTCDNPTSFFLNSGIPFHCTSNVSSYQQISNLASSSHWTTVDKTQFLNLQHEHVAISGN